MTEARQQLAEARELQRAAREATAETIAAGEAARAEQQRLEAAKREAVKVWKRERPATDNVILLKLRDLQDVLDEDEEIYRGFSGLEDKIASVIAKAEDVLAEADDGYTPAIIQRLYDFYLPKTIAVLERYKNIFSSGLPPKAVRQLRTDVLNAIDKSTEVYNNVLVNLYERDMMDLVGEMAALKTIFALEGLLDSDFDIMRTEQTENGGTK